ncbi:hypothetical protein HPB47_008585 [Ixodes persulcatus]|uniref:Uncharacterized protein n=1 Tax=Ixodes persulcatus TaxID=34615 RepID=A0AC60P4B0_IXOPE|nr:hypothetical protein HPB47_008585 [Ixodes persulcatus]
MYMSGLRTNEWLPRYWRLNEQGRSGAQNPDAAASASRPAKRDIASVAPVNTAGLRTVSPRHVLHVAPPSLKPKPDRPSNKPSQDESVF